MDQVKNRLNLAEDFVDWDARINDALDRADNWINGKLAPYTGIPIALPLGAPDLILSDIASDYAAGLLQEEGATNPTAVTTPGAMAGMGKLRRRAAKTLNDDYIRPRFGVDPEADVQKGTVLGSVHLSGSSYMTDEMQAEWPWVD
jgi:hypothetical protein